MALDFNSSLAGIQPSPQGRDLFSNKPTTSVLLYTPVLANGIYVPVRLLTRNPARIGAIIQNLDPAISAFLGFGRDLQLSSSALNINGLPLGPGVRAIFSGTYTGEIWISSIAPVRIYCTAFTQGQFSGG